MKQRRFLTIATLVASAFLPACGLLGGGAPEAVLPGTVLHGRYVDPAGQLSVRIPSTASMRGLRAEVDGDGAGYLAVAGSWGGNSRFEWSPVPSGQRADETFQRVREYVLGEIRSQVPTAELVHTERLEYRGAPAECFVLYIPGGSSWARVEWFQRTSLDLRIAFLQFRHGDLSIHVASEDTPQLFNPVFPEESGVRALMKGEAARLIELADRICFDDPLVAELQQKGVTASSVD